MCSCVEGVVDEAVCRTLMRDTLKQGGMGGLDHTGMRCRWGSGQQGRSYHEFPTPVSNSSTKFFL